MLALMLIEFINEISATAKRQKNGKFRGVLANEQSRKAIFLIRNPTATNPIKTFTAADEKLATKGIIIIPQ
jgi:hypothetical protein